MYYLTAKHPTHPDFYKDMLDYPYISEEELLSNALFLMGKGYIVTMRYEIKK